MSCGAGAICAANIDELLKKAGQLIEEGRMPAAWEVLEEAHKADPAHATVLYQRGYVLYRQRKLGEARSAFEQVVKTAPPALYSRYFLGRIALLEDKPQEAVRWLEPMVKSGEKVHDAEAQLGKAYLEARRLREALRATNAAVQAAPWDGSLYYRLGRIHQQLEEPELAREAFETSQRLKSADRASVQKLLECSQALQKGDRTEALRLGEELLADERTDPNALVALGVLLANRGMAAESLKPFRAAAGKSPDLYQAHYNLGLAWMKQGRFDEAEPALRKALEILPQAPEANAAAGVVDVLKGRYKEAIPKLEAARRLETAEARVLSLLGLAYVRTGRAKEAIPLLNEVIENQADDPKPRFLLIEAHNANEDPGAALDAAGQCRAMFPKLAQAHLAEAQQMARMGRYQEAGNGFAKVLELAPGQPDALLGLGEAQNKGGDYEGSLASYEAVLRQEGTNTTALLGAARNLTALKRFEEARTLLERAVPLAPESQQVRYELSRVYARMGQREKAAEQTKALNELISKQGGTNTGR